MEDDAEFQGSDEGIPDGIVPPEQPGHEDEMTRARYGNELREPLDRAHRQGLNDRKVHGTRPPSICSAVCAGERNGADRAGRPSATSLVMLVDRQSCRSPAHHTNRLEDEERG